MFFSIVGNMSEIKTKKPLIISGLSVKFVEPEGVKRLNFTST